MQNDIELEIDDEPSSSSPPCMDRFRDFFSCTVGKKMKMSDLLLGFATAACLSLLVLGITVFAIFENNNTNVLPEIKLKPMVILLSIDGLSHELINDQFIAYVTTNLQQLLKQSFFARVKPNFPSTSAPNLYSLVSGLYPVSHGLIGSWFINPTNQEVFSASNTTNPKQYERFSKPIWSYC